MSQEEISNFSQSSWHDHVDLLTALTTNWVIIGGANIDGFLKVLFGAILLTLGLHDLLRVKSTACPPAFSEI